MHPKAVGSVPTGAAEKRLSTSVSRVSRLCPIFRAQPGAYPPKAQNRTLRRCAGEQEIRPKPSAAGSVEKGNAAEWTRPAACGKCGKSLKMVKIEGFWTPRRESRINGWRRNRRFSCSQQPAVRTVSMGCAGAAIGACLKENTHGWRQKSHKRRRFKGFRRATPQIGGL